MQDVARCEAIVSDFTSLVNKLEESLFTGATGDVTMQLSILVTIRDLASTLEVGALVVLKKEDIDLKVGRTNLKT